MIGPPYIASTLDGYGRFVENEPPEIDEFVRRRVAIEREKAELDC